METMRLAIRVQHQSFDTIIVEVSSTTLVSHVMEIVSPKGIQTLVNLYFEGNAMNHNQFVVSYGIELDSVIEAEIIVKPDNEQLIEMMKTGDEETVVRLIKADMFDTDIHTRGSLLKRTIENNRENLALQILNIDNVDVNISFLLSAMKFNCLAVFRSLAEHPKIDINSYLQKSFYRESILCFACSCGDINIVKMLVNHPDILINKQALSIPDGEEWSPLWLAAERGHIEVVKCLLTHPDIDVTVGSYLDSPIVGAEMRGHLEIGDLIRNHSRLALSGSDEEYPVS